MNRTWDVIVVGARVAGAATAMLLARAGLRVLCVDRSRHGSDTLSTHALMRGGVLQLTKWGLLDAVVAAGTPPVRRTVFHYGEEQFAVSIKPAAGTDALYAPRRTVLDALLVDEAVRSGVIVEFGTPVVGLCRAADDRVTGVLAAGSPHRPGARRIRRDRCRGRRPGVAGGPRSVCYQRVRRAARRFLPVRVLARSPVRRLRVVLPAGPGRRDDPHQ